MFIIVLVCPFNIVYKSSRYRFLSVIRNIVLSPLYKVLMLDFFMADQLCSQVISSINSFKLIRVNYHIWTINQSPYWVICSLFFNQVPTLRNLEYIACYYITGSYKTEDFGYCMRNTYYKDLAYAVSFLPYYWRAMQVILLHPAVLIDFPFSFFFLIYY